MHSSRYIEFICAVWWVAKWGPRLKLPPTRVDPRLSPTYRCVGASNDRTAKISCFDRLLPTLVLRYALPGIFLWGMFVPI